MPSPPYASSESSLEREVAAIMVPAPAKIRIKNNQTDNFENEVFQNQHNSTSLPVSARQHIKNGRIGNVGIKKFQHGGASITFPVPSITRFQVQPF